MFKAEAKLNNILTYQVGKRIFKKGKPQLLLGEEGRQLALRLKNTRGFVIKILEDTPDEKPEPAMVSPVARDKKLYLED